MRRFLDGLYVFGYRATNADEKALTERCLSTWAANKM